MRDLPKKFWIALCSVVIPIDVLLVIAGINASHHPYTLLPLWFICLFFAGVWAFTSLVAAVICSFKKKGKITLGLWIGLLIVVFSSIILVVYDAFMNLF